MDKMDRTVANLFSRVTYLEAEPRTRAWQSNQGSSTNTPSQSSKTHSTTQYTDNSVASANEHPVEYSSGHSQPESNLSVPHRVVLWPAVRQLLSDSGWALTQDLEDLSQQGTSWFLKRERAKHPHSFPTDDGSTASTSTSRTTNEGLNLDASLALSLPQAYEYAGMYFRTFNLVLPILEHDLFRSTLERLSREGCRDGDPGAVLALLVFALGELATSAVLDEPITAFDSFSSGFRGGTVDHPPGLRLFNQARRRLGFVSSLCTLETTQIFLLEGMYYEANAHHLEFWRSSTSASMAIQVLMKSEEFDWVTHKGDMISRAYWACLMQEDLYHLELDLPKSGIDQLEDDVPLPSFRTPSGPESDQSQANGRHSHYQHHFLAMITLRRLIVRIHNTVHEAKGTRAESSDQSGPPMRVIYEMSRQLESWRSLLPKPLQWLDDDVFRFPNNGTAHSYPNTPLFFQERDRRPVVHEGNIDILTAQLRTRFYYARYVLYRPFIYRALHFPEQINESEAEFCVLAVDSMCLWPCLMAPLSSKKRLVPHLYTWTQNILGILLIIKLTEGNDDLRWICESKVDPDRIKATSALMLDWMEDTKQVDSIANWSWTMLQYLYREDPT